MSWHHFQAGEAYPVDEIVTALRRRLNRIKDVEGKSQMIAEFELHRGTDVVWSPFGKSWGRSPYDKNAWKRLDGSEFIPRSPRSKRG